jgi:hypothetical protein
MPKTPPKMPLKMPKKMPTEHLKNGLEKVPKMPPNAF